MYSDPVRGDPALKSGFFSRRCLAVLIVIAMTAFTSYVLINDSDSSVAEAETSGSCGDELTWSFDPGTGTLTISGTGRMDDYEPMCAPWAGKDVRSVTMNDGITHIGDFSFFFCTSLKSISISSTVLSIGQLAFLGCTSLASIDVEEGNTAYSSVNGVLYNKDRTEICQYPAGKTDTVYTIPDSVTSLGENAFFGCTGLTSVTLGNGVESIGNQAFGRCSSLTTMTLPASVTSLGFDLFFGCTSLTAINVDENNSYFVSVDGVLFSKDLEKLIKYPCGKAGATYNIPETTTSIESGSFEGSIYLESVTIPKSVTMIYPLTFNDCPALVSIVVDKDNERYSSEDGVLFCSQNNNVKDHLYMYPGGKAETTYTVPAFVKEIESSAFRDSNLKEVVFSEDASVKLHSESFYNCLKLETIIIGASAELDFDECALAIEDGKQTIRVYSDTEIPADALEGDITLLYVKSVTYDIDDGTGEAPAVGYYVTDETFTVASYSGTKDGFTFGGWNDGSKDYAAGSEYTMGTSNVVLKAVWKGSSVDTYTVTYVVNGGSAAAPTQADVAEGAKFTVASYSGTKDGFTFGGWNDGSKDYAAGSEYTMGTSNVVLTAVWNVVSVENSGSCGDNLTWSFDSGTLTISGTGEMSNYRPRTAPWADKDVISVIMNDGITHIGDFSFFNCKSLESISIPSTVESIGNRAFWGCSSLTAINVDEGNSKFASVDGGLFSKDLKKLIKYPCGKADATYNIPDTTTTIENGSFEGSIHLKSVIMKEGITSIGEFSFLGCESLESISIPSTVESIGNRAFGECSSLTTITLPASVTSMGFDIFIGCTSLTAINVDEDNSNFASVDGVLFSKDLKSLIAYPCGKADAIYNIPETTTTIENGSFDGSIHLESVTIPKSVVDIYPTFTDCPALVSIVVDKDNERYSSEDGVLFCCYNNNVKDHLYVYPEGKAETTYTVPAFVKEIETFAFTDSNLKKVVFSEDASVTLDYGSFHNCLKLETIIIDASAEVYFDECAFSIDEGKHTIRIYSDTKLPQTAVTGNITLLYMKSVTYVVNGGSADAPTQADVAEGAKFIVASYSGTKTGFTFDGWNDGSKDYAAGSEYTMGESDVVLTAVWKESSVDTHTVTYDVNGGSATAPSQADVAEGAKFIVASYSGTKTGFTFGGWNDGSKTYAAGSEYTMGVSDVVLTAVWTPITHTVTFNANGGTCATATKTTDAQGRIDVLPEATRSGYTLKGWFTAAEGGEKVEVSRIYIANTTVYAQWTEVTVPTHPVTYDVDGGSATAPTQAAVAEGAKFTVASYSGTKDGFTFGGWNDGSKTYAAGSEYTMGTSNVILTAVWNVVSVENSGSCGDNLAWSFDPATGVLTITGTGTMWDFDETTVRWGGNAVKSVVIEDSVTSIGNNAFKGCSSIDSITLGNGVTTISDNAFNGCTCLTSIDIPDSVTALGDGVFNGCTGLTSVTIGNGITAIEEGVFNGITSLKSVTLGNGVKTIENNAFNGCTGLTSIDVPDSVTTIGDGVFNGCTGLTSVTLGNGVKTIGDNAFNGCTGLTSIDIPDSVTDLDDGVFNGCTGLKSVTLGDGITTLEKGMFADCHDLESVALGNGITAIEEGVFNGITSLKSVTLGNGVKTIGDNAFNGCTGLTSIDIPDSVTALGNGVFNGCTGLTSIDIPDSVTTIGDNAFNGCTGMTSIDIPDSVTALGDGVFKGCTGLKSVTLGDGITTLEKGMFADCHDLESVALGNGITAIEEGVFNGITSLKSVTLGNGVKTIGDNAFNRCTGLTSIDIPDSVTTIGDNAFNGCTGLTSIDLPDSVTTIGDNVFNGCTGMTSIDIPDSVTALGDGVFKGCTGLKSVTLGDGITTLEKGMFADCHDLESVALGNGITAIEEGVFNGITSLKSVTLGNGVKTIGDNAFNRCTGLTSIDIPDSVTTIGDNAFFGCTGLTSVKIGNGVTTIGDNAFNGCTSLASIDIEEGNTAYSSVNGVLFNKDRTEIRQYPAGKTDTVYTIPDSVTSLGDNAFNGCTGLTSVTIGNGVATIGDNAFNGCTSLASIDVEEENTAYSSVNGVLFNKDRTEICQYPAGKTDTVYTIPGSVTAIGDNAFNGCTSLTSIEVDGDNPAFSSSDGYLLNKAGDELLVCPAGLESATVGNGITKVSEGAFSGDKLKEVVFSGTSVSVTVCAFKNCASLNKIVIKSPDVVFEENSITFTDSEKHTLHVVAPKGYQIPNNAMSANVDIVYDGQSSDPDDEGSKTLIGIAVAIVILLALASLVPQITRRP